MDWSLLPEDVVGVILANLSLVELARASLTCRSFKAAYDGMMVVHKSPDATRLSCLAAVSGSRTSSHLWPR
jgi:hypothetical protein